jgi:hypothetical protein
MRATSGAGGDNLISHHHSAGRSESRIPNHSNEHVVHLPEDDWSQRINPMTGMLEPNPRLQTTRQPNIAVQSPTASFSNTSHGPLDTIMFPTENPFAYPLIPGVTLQESASTTLHEDLLRLPLYNAHVGTDDQYSQLQEPLHGTLHQSNNSTNPISDAGQPGPIQTAIARMLHELEEGRLWDGPAPHELHPFLTRH